MLSPNLEHVRTFLVVARHLHFGRSAAVLGVTQPAVSQHIRRLEEAIGAPLLERTNRSVALTPRGDALARRMRDVVTAFDFAVTDARPFATNEVTPLRLACTPTAGTLAPRLREAAAQVSRLPVVDLQWEVDVLAGLHRGYWSFVVGHALPQDQDVVQLVHLREDPLRLIVSGHASDSVKRLQDLGDAELVLPPPDLAPSWHERLRAILSSVTGREPFVRSVPVTNASWLDDLRGSVDGADEGRVAYTVVPASGVPPHVRSISLAPLAVPLVLMSRKSLVRSDALEALRTAADELSDGKG